jgi:hypothetical protein
MKKFLFLATSFAIGFLASAQQKADEVIKVNFDKYDFGKIKQGTPVVTYFTVTNISNKPVVIENAYAGCGCTTPEVSKAPIAPNSSTKVKVGYNAAAMGHFEKPVTIKLAGVQEPKIINITGEVVDANAYAAYTKTDEYKKYQKEKASREAKEAKDAKKSAKHVKNSVSSTK